MAYLSEAALIFWQRWYTGWITLRNQLTTPIRLMGRRVISLFDSLLSGTDLEITPRLTLQRRPGYINYFSGAMNGTLLNSYSWKTASQGTFQIFDTTLDVEFIAPGATAPTVIFTKPNNAVGNKGYMFGVGNYLFVSGIGFAFKWDGPTGTQGVTNWGIANSQSTGGPNTAVTGSNVAAGSATVNWINVGNVASSTNYATINVPAGTLGKYLAGTNFGFSVTGQIVGIQISLNAAINAPGSNESLAVFMLKNGQIVGAGKGVTGSSGVQNVTLGGAGDLWGTGWTSNDINGANFGFAIIGLPRFFGSKNAYTAQANDFVVTVFTGSQITASATGSGSFAAINGWSYVMAYGNSVSGEISNASTPSTNTGPFNSKAQVTLALTASADTQVNQIHVYRTTDSGGGSIYFELPTSPYPNTTGSVNDSATDTQLQVGNLAATNLQNTPPPANMIAMEWFAGRMWGAVGHQLYFSTGPDSLSGLQQSNWNPVYVQVMPAAITRNTALPNGMLIHTLSEIQVARGTSTTAFTFTTFIKDTGLWNYNAADTDGSNVYMFTADRQFINVTAQGVEEVGPSGICPIADQLQLIDPTTAYVTAFRSGLDAMVFLLDTTTGILYPYNTRQQAWCLPAMLKFTPNACGAMEVQPGIWKFLIGTGAKLAQRDLNTFTDLGTTYTPQVVIGTIQEADPGTLAKMENVFLELTNAGSVPTVSILPNDAGVTLTNAIGSQITGSFVPLINPVNDPPTYGATSTNYRSLRYYWLTSKSPEAVKYVQILIQFAAEAAQNEVLGLGLSGKQQGDVQATGALPQLQGH